MVQGTLKTFLAASQSSGNTSTAHLDRPSRRSAGALEVISMDSEF
jgi:hypothetical protein